jgi:hypothetical protein
VLKLTIDLQAGKECVTEALPLVGSEHWSPTMFIKLAQTYGLETEVMNYIREMKIINLYLD